MFATLVTSSKGGCGKSTLVTELAAQHAQAGRNTLILDADRQHSSYHWAEIRPDNVPGVLALDGNRRQLARLPPDTDQLLIDTPAGVTPRDLEPWLEVASAVLVPVLPSAFDLDATLRFLGELAGVPAISRGRLPVALVANRLKPWTHASQDALARIKAEAPFKLVAGLRDSQAYVLLAGLGKGLFDYQSEAVRSHQEDWKPLLRWLKRQG